MRVLGIDPPFRVPGVLGAVELFRETDDASIKARDLTVYVNANSPRYWAQMIVREVEASAVDVVALKTTGATDSVVRTLLAQVGLTVPLKVLHFKTQDHLQRFICMIENRQIDCKDAPLISSDVLHGSHHTDRIAAALPALAVLFDREPRIKEFD